MTTDPDFGVLRSFSEKDPSLRHWNGQVLVPAVGHPVDCQMVAPSTGPTAAQRRFLLALDRHYPAVLDASLPLLAAKLKADLGTLTPGDLAPLFKLTEVWIPEQESSDMEWDLTFDCPAAGETFMVDMRGWEPQDVEEA